MFPVLGCWRPNSLYKCEWVFHLDWCTRKVKLERVVSSELLCFVILDKFNNIVSTNMAEGRTPWPAHQCQHWDATLPFIHSSQGGFKAPQSKCGIVLASCHNKELLRSSSVVVRYPVDEMHSWISSHHSDKHTSTPRISPSTSLDLTHQRRILQHHLRSPENVCLILCFSKFANS